MSAKAVKKQKTSTGKAKPVAVVHNESNEESISESSQSASEDDESVSETHDSSAADDSDIDDEHEIDAASDSNDDSDEDSDDDIPKLKKKKNTDDGSASFANAFTNIIGSKLKAHSRAAPIMTRNKVVLKKLETDKLEHKAKRALLSEKKQAFDKHRVKNLLPTGEEENIRQILESEKKLKKVAQKGVVRLFNAIMSTQVRTNEAISKEKVGQVKKEELFNEMSKEKFLDLVQSTAHDE
ncbi:pre-60S ribosomal particles component [Yamadazyma tenuis]|uniref:Rrp15p-domain-containing protein n=1 Tax=Candida tenuis (strain ATCC 10573 / BCRC 21748 / CBS 615 / JCM 9827 / NBRC 10315 / NRRL Y-1498 / VKM Y-70) TaxID=590646 RepID=G3BC09_CANTC|nr:Rrp15p-domain-containing protein [Yamadazyma tenuis ATCC 10573]EGV60752.1 Rrp15p-domain-containing protein [Yamadazyma tenuis ATCC 10573]WEJ93976.1 pre-60S ribosomal particles component [Yamadazyma tenuis]